eukprot:CAMPEP_0117519466 /NCGR_PEP_ID=MMETSP0784-20121206/32664_1 /TAXON_ID=39447 /ORGANISM="" /LENGTH=973 /DNA_ID=CAMNT_0005315423 /DNA_START=19 /DNA_END=2940 /DNA_ORIENTATION=+
MPGVDAAPKSMSGRLTARVYPADYGECKAPAMEHLLPIVTNDDSLSDLERLQEPPPRHDSFNVARRNNLLTSHSHGTLKEIQFLQRPKTNRRRQWSQKIVDSKYFIVYTTVLTLYALVGDDVRLLFTDKPLDVAFNYITLVCILSFSTEIVLSCMGKDDYIMGFFFTLDVISTVTLVLDLTWVTQYLNLLVESDSMRSGRTARVGARLGRSMRILRLVRILKLYKAINQERARQKKAANTIDNEDDWDDEEKRETAVKMENVQESRVGRKLSEMTTRRVILLVLTMLLVLPQLQTGSLGPLGVYYGADDVAEAFQEMKERPTWDEGPNRYQRTLLKFIYYNNWFSRDLDCHGDTMCPSDQSIHLFWFGVVAPSEDQVSNLEQLSIEAALSSSTVRDFNEWAAVQNEHYRYGTMPNEALDIMSSAWTGNCNNLGGRELKYRFGVSLLSSNLEGHIDHLAPCPEDLRDVEVIPVRPLRMTLDQTWRFEFYFDVRKAVRDEARYAIVLTAFICIILTIASLYFSSDANRLVLGPVEKMINRLETIRKNPFVAIKMADEEFRDEEKLQQQMEASRAKRGPAKCCVQCFSSPAQKQEPMETVVLEKTIIKLGSLLALGLGVAGANIIGHNMQSCHSAGVNVMVTGTLVDCIIGTTRIADFSIATEVLQGKVLTFVNQIAEIVHGLIEEFHGSPNKNSGESFLLVWRTSGLSQAQRRKMADMSIVAFTKILGGIHRSSVLASYRGHPGLQQRLGSDYRVCLTFGLHAGWAIEGAVGSEYKIDASYLSPNVSIAAGVEHATSIYNVPILISEAVRDLSTPGMAQKCRLIDRVIISGSKTPLTLHTLDLDYMRLRVDPVRGRSFAWSTRQRFKVRQFLEVEKTKKMEEAFSMSDYFDQADDIIAMRQKFSVKFHELFKMGFQNYLQGEWEVARRLLSMSRSMNPVGDDGPSAALIRFMELAHFRAPEGWRGIRYLQELDVK